MNGLWCDLGERLQDEQPFVHARMRDGQLRLVAHDVAVDQQVKIDRARALALLASPAQSSFHFQEDPQESVRWEIGLQLCGCIEVSPLACRTSNRRSHVI